MEQVKLKHKDHFHGSDLEKIEDIYGIKKEDIVSYSANINPLGISQNLKDSISRHIDAIQTYPDREYKELRRTIAGYAGTNYENIIVGNGSTELISLVISTIAPKKAMILGPTYSEYEREITLKGGHTLYYPLREENDFALDVDDLCSHLNDGIDLLILCNPNNPTSSAINRSRMRTILDSCMEHGIFVMVDETYVEFTHADEKISSVPLTEYYTNLAILRGTSKFFAAPGLRLGYAVTGNADLIRRIQTMQNPWSISSLAEIAGRLMFQDEAYIRETGSLIDQERKRMYEAFSAMDTVKTYPPKANFLLVRILKDDVDAQQLFEHCIRKGLMIRNCSTFPFLSDKYFRFCFMSPEDNDRLLEAIRELL
ncbi:MAG: threonine-phosphate decarboxylase CobD [Eubacterium sp.]|jgi:threonine-phosphate decarboxylase|nr:threonine-phosphate decarboxylase CobD [Eubacterium sp.]